MPVNEFLPNGLMLPDESVIAGQARLIETMNIKNGIGNQISVSPHTLRRGVDTNQRFVAYYASFINDSSVAAFAASGTGAKRHGVTTMLVTAPNQHESGLRAYDRGNRLYASSYWIVEGTEMHHITPDSPVPIDGLIFCYDGEQVDPVVEQQLGDTIKRTIALTEDKVYTKDLLMTRGVNVPSPHINTRNIDIVVIKPRRGAYGDGYDQHKATFLDSNTGIYSPYRNIELLNNPTTKLLYEEYIDPAPVDSLAQWMNNYLKAHEGPGHSEITSKMIASNYRIITSFNRNPRIIDEEVRFGLKNNGPINVSKGAFVQRAEGLMPPKHIKIAENAALKATHHIFDGEYAPKEGDSTHLYLCTDVIIGPYWKPYILEAGLFSGGFASLTRIDGEPLQSIGDIYIPAQVPYLRRRAKTREDLPKKFSSLRSIPRFSHGEHNIYCRGCDFSQLRTAMQVII